MLIVSQDGKKIVNYNNINMIMVRENKIISFDNTYTDNQDGDCLGTYATEERAKEVLVEMIQYFYNTEILKCKSDFFYIDNLNRLQENAFVYEMPKE